jgi:hypothetical protein
MLKLNAPGAHDGLERKDQSEKTQNKANQNQ